MEERFVPTPQAEARPAPSDRPGDAGSAGERPVDDPRALQILSTEHWSLLTARSLVYNETFARGGMFLGVLSATLVALGLIATATGFSDALLTVCVVVLGLDLFIGLATLSRVSAATSEDLRYLQGMNRLRHAYFEIAPGLQRYFITSGHDDFPSVVAPYGPGQGSYVQNVLHGFTTMPGMISVICCGLVGVLVAVIALLVTHDGTVASASGLLAGLGFLVFITTVLARWAIGMARRMVPIFPPSGAPKGPPAT